MSELSKYPNIGKVVEQQLYQAGITHYTQLVEIGSKQAWLRIQAIDPTACLHRLYALEGAIQNIKKTELSKECKEDLKEFYMQHKQ